MNVALILAGGVGARLGAKIPKQFIEVLGKPILAYTLEAFEKHSEIEGSGYSSSIRPIQATWTMKSLLMQPLGRRLCRLKLVLNR